MRRTKLIPLYAITLAAIAWTTPVASQETALAAIAARDLPRGATLTADDIRYAAVSDPRGGSDPDVAPGWVTRRVVNQGEPLRTPAVAPPLAVSHGDQVDVLVRRGAITLRMRGTAMGSAALGERVTVRIDSRRRVDGLAAGPGVVHLNGANP